MTLYELTNEMLRLQMWLEEDDAEEDQALADTLAMVAQDFEEKADGYGMVIRNMEARAAEIKAQEEILKEEIKRLAAQRGVEERGVERLKETLQKALALTGKKNLKTEKFTFGTRSSSSVVITTTDVFDIPDELLRYRDPEPDKTAIKDYLKDHEVEWAHIETKTSLSLR